MTNRTQKSIEINEFKLEKGCRSNVHPKLAILDEINTQVWYNKSDKFLYVEYDIQKDGTYAKAIMSPSVNTIEEIIQQFIKEKYELSEDY